MHASYVNKDFFMMTCPAVFFVSFPSAKYPKIDGNDEKLNCYHFWYLASYNYHSNQQQKR